MIEQNPWWVNEIDEKYEEWKSKKYKYVPEEINDFSLKPFSLNFLIGPRQIGKTTLLKILIYKLLSEGYNPKSIFYYSCDELLDYRELGEILDNYLEFKKENRIKSSVIILDEITFVDEWYRAIKSRIDRGLFKNDVLIISGSVSIEILAQKELFVGRRGFGKDVYLLPITFRKFLTYFTKIKPFCTDNLLSLKDFAKKNKVYEEKLKEYFKIYLKTGGFPLSIIDYFERGKVRYETYKTYFDWIRNDLLKLRKNELYFREIIKYIIESRLSPISFYSIARETSVNSVDTVISYINLLENMFIIKVLYKIGADKKVDVRANKKIHVIDPFLYEVFRKILRVNYDEGQLIESVVFYNFFRYKEDVYYYRTSTGKEVDFVVKVNDHLIGVEVKKGKKESTVRSKIFKEFYSINEENIHLYLASIK